MDDDECYYFRTEFYDTCVCEWEEAQVTFRNTVVYRANRFEAGFLLSDAMFLYCGCDKRWVAKIAPFNLNNVDLEG